MTYYKFPRIYHFSDSPNLQNDDRRHENESLFNNREVIASIKVDGESSSLYTDKVHARSIDSGTHPSREWIKGLQGEIGYLIPTGYRVCGENLYAKHSIQYHNLKSYFYLYSIFNNHNEALSWDETITWATLLNLETVDIFYRGVYDRKLIHNKYEEYCNNSIDDVEGYVVRVTESIPYENFSKYHIKYVRSGHVQTDQHWMTKPVIPNELRK
jgi:hypothetical protein